MTEHAFEPMRRAMVASQLRTTGVNDPRVVAAMGRVPRERFVPEDRQALAYADALVPLAPGRDMSPPMAVGRLLTEARLRGDERALVVGAATGYSAALLAELVASVVALEEDEALAQSAARALKGTSAQVVKGPLGKGWPKGAPYDFILVDGAVEHLPQALIDQLADGGQMALALAENGVSRLAIGRSAGGAFGLTAFADVATAFLPGFAEPRGFSFA